MLKKVITRHGSILGMRVSRKGSCGNLDPLIEKLYKSLNTGEEKVRSSYKDLPLPHTLGLLSTTLSTAGHSSLSFTDDLTAKVTSGLQPYTKRSSDRLPLDLVVDLACCVVYVSRACDDVMPDGLDRLAVVAVGQIKKQYAALSKSDKAALKDALELLAGKKERLSEKLRKGVDSLRTYIKKVDRMKSTQFTIEYLKAFRSENYIDTEKDFEFDFDQEHDCFLIHNKKDNKSFSMFQFGQFDQVSQIIRYRDFMEKTPDIDSLVIDVVPCVDPDMFRRSDPGDQKLYEYSQNVVNDWPYLYKFHGKEDLRKLYYSMVFDKEFYEERNEMMYCKLDKHSRVLDVNNTLMAYFTGYGDRTSAPSVYFSSLILEERIMEATYSMTKARSRQLCDLNSLQHILASTSILETAKISGCSECGGWLETLPYYLAIEKMYRAELESSKSGSVAANVMMEAFQRLPENTKGVFAAATSCFDRSLPQMLERIRQQRLSGYDPLEYKRQDFIKDVFKKACEVKFDNDFFEHLAQIESVMGRVESTLNQFVDLAQSESFYNYYDQKRMELVNLNVIGYWDPSFIDTTPEKLCLAEHVALPYQIETKAPKRIWHTGDKKELDLMKKIDENLAKYEKTDESKKHGKGRKIKLKMRESAPMKIDLSAPFDTKRTGPNGQVLPGGSLNKSKGRQK